MTDPGDAPSAWRLLWSPKAMAWWACYRPVPSLRLGSIIIGLWLGIDLAYILWLELPDDPFASDLTIAYISLAAAWLTIITLAHSWTWFVRPRQIDQGRYADWLVLPLAATPVVIISLPWYILETFFFVTQMVELLNNADGGSQELPGWLVAFQSSWIVSWLPTTTWLVWMLLAGRYVRQMQKQLYKNLCGRCRYDLRATRAAGIGRCPECGAAVDELAGNPASVG